MMEELKMSAKKRIGEIDGPWGILFRLSLVLIPLATAYLVYLHKQIDVNSKTLIAMEERVKTLEAFASKGDRMTAKDGLELELKLTRESSANHRLLEDRLRIIENQDIDRRMLTMERAVLDLAATLSQTEKDLTEIKSNVRNLVDHIKDGRIRPANP